MDEPLLERLRRALTPEFEVERRLAAGGMGIVFRAREVALDRPVAIKVLRPELATAVARERFLQEARLLARLQHPNIVSVHRADERDGLPFYVMDFIEGQTLADRLASGPIPSDELVRLGHDLLRGLAAAHAAGIVHRDVKPQNIFFVRGRALLGDFGIARDDTREDGELTEEGLLLGTRGYMSPEQLRGQPATERSDQYSGAAVLYQAASGRQWKAIDTPSQADWRGIPRPMAAVLKRALAADPARRWPTMQEVRRAFDRGKGRTAQRIATVAVTVLVLLLGRAAYHWIIPAAPADDHRMLAVLPFRGLRPADDSLGAIIAANADINLINFPRLSKASYQRAAQWQQEHPTDETATALRDLDVDQVVSGLVEARGDTLSLTLTVTDSTGSMPLQPIKVAGAAAQWADLGRLAALTIGTQVSGRQVDDIRNQASQNPGAALSYVRGEANFENDEWDLAAQAYQQAFEMDPTFALARWRILVAQIWARQYSAEQAAALAACCADQLPKLESGLVQAMGEPNLVRRFAMFDSLAGEYSDVSLFLLLYASELFHRGPLLGRDLSRSLDMFEAAKRTNHAATPAPAYDHLIWGNTRLGNRENARRWLTAREELDEQAPSHSPIVDFLQLGYELRWLPWMARAKLWLVKPVSSESTLGMLAKFYRFSATFDAPDGLDQIGRLFASELLTADRASGLEAQGLAALTWGKVKPGLAFIDSASALFKTPEAELQRHQWRLMLPVLGAGRASAEEESAARRWLKAQADEGQLAARARWTLAMDALGHGDSTTAVEMVASLADLGARDSVASQLARLAAAILVGQRDPRRALDLSADLRGSDSPAPGNDVFSRSILHLSRARWFEAAGMPKDAEREILWYENSDTYQFPDHEAQKMEVDAVASVAARVTRARLLLAAGDSTRACRMLERVHELWRNANASLEASVAHADSLYREGCP